MGASESTLFERDEQIAALSVALESLKSSAGSIVLVQGPPGIGKSRLLLYLRAQAGRVTVLRARGGQLERNVSFGVVRELYEPVVREAAEAADGTAFAGPAALTKRLFDPEPAAQPVQDSVYTIMRGLYWLTANLGEDRPVLIAVDDAHWLDTASERFLAYLVPRVQDLGVLMVLAIRPRELDQGGPLAAALAAVGPEVRIVEPRNLSERATAAVVAEATGREPDSAFCFAVHASTGGNPLLVRTVARSLARRGVAPTAANVHHAVSVDGGDIHRIVLPRISRFGAGALALVRALAVLGDEASLPVLFRVADLDREGWASYDALVSGEILVAGPSAGFVHPLVRSVVLDGTPVHERSRLNMRAAHILVEHEADPEGAARHLVEVEPTGDEWVPAVLREAALRAHARGATETAITYLTRALAEPRPKERGALLVELATAEAALQRPAAVGHLLTALAELPPGTERGAAGLLLARLLAFAGRNAEAYAVATDVRNELESANPRPESREIALYLDALLIVATGIDPSIWGRARDRFEQIEALPGRTAAERAAMTALAWELAKAAEPVERIRRLVDRCLGAGGGSNRLTPDGYSPAMSSALLHFIGDTRRGIQLATGLIDEARATGSPTWYVTACAMRAMVGLYAGDLLEAEVDARAALEAHDLPFVAMNPLAVAALVGTLTERADYTAALQVAERFTFPPDRDDQAMAAVPAAWQGHLLTQLGRIEEAVACLQAAGQALEAVGAVSAEVSPWRYHLVLALLRAGQHDTARAVLGPARETSARSGAPYGLATTLHAAALLERPVNTAMLQEALEVLAGRGLPLLEATVLIDLGTALRVTGRAAQAREPLTAAMDLAHSCGGTRLAERARTELVATGARPRRIAVSGPAALTAAELRTARMAAAGMSNSQIAQALFVTKKTVEKHLGNAYTKLGTSSRAALGELLDPNR